MTELSGPLAPPNLGSVISAADIDKKGTGSYAADYVNWARTAQLLRENAPGWQFHLRPTADGQHVWQAPNGTGYVVGYFEGPGGATPDFPQAVMDNRNAAVPLDKIDARDLTDTHRRCLCTAAAAQFGLAWQLWAKEPVENPHRDEPTAPAKPAANPPAARQAAPTRQAPTRQAPVRQAAAASQAPTRPPAQASQPQPAAPSQPLASQAPTQPQPTSHPLPGPVATTAAAVKACQEAGLTQLGIVAMCREMSSGQAGAIAGLSLGIQQRLATNGVSAPSVAKWNAAGAAAGAAQTDDDPDLPRTWDGPAAA